MPDVIQDSNSVSRGESLSDASSRVTDPGDEACVHPEEENTNNNGSVFGRKRPSGRMDAVIAETLEENIEIMKRTLRCFQCHRVFLSMKEVEDEDHYCAFFGNLRTPLKIDPSPTPTKKVSLKCVMCPSPVFTDTTELMKHIILGHEMDWFMRDAENHIHLLTDSEYALHECWNCDCDDFAESEEDYFIHQGIHHGQLFWALKHHRHHNFKNLCKRLFPGKMKDNPHLLWSEDSMDEEREARKRGLDDENTDESTGSSTKRILLLADKSREEAERSEDTSQENEGIDQDEDSDVFFPNEYLNGNKDADADPKDNSNEETGTGCQQDSSDTNSEPCRKAKKTAKLRIQSSSEENASESNVSDSDDDYSEARTEKKKRTPSKVARNSPFKPMERKECPICFENWCVVE